MNRLTNYLKAYNQIPNEIIDMLSHLDAFTFNHSLRVCDLCKLVEQEMSLGDNKLSMAGLVHDVGKYYIASRILDKPDTLDEIERIIIDIHSYIGYRILQSNEVDDEICQLALFHHSLTPLSFSKQIIKCTDEEIAKKSVYLKTCDVYEALTTDRPYHRRRSKSEASSIIRGMPEHNEDVLKIIISSDI